MTIGRRSFLKRASGLLAAAVAAPLYIPAERLAFGVPRPRPPAELSEWAFTEHGFFAPGIGGSILDRNLFAAPDRAISQPYTFRYSLHTAYATDASYVYESDELFPAVAFEMAEANTVSGVTVDFPDGRPSFTERFSSISFMAGDTIDVQFNWT